MARLASLAGGLLLLAVSALPTGPELYGAGLFSTGEWDFFIAFAPHERRVLFCRANDDFSSYDIYETERENGRWRAPVKPSFAESWSNADPHFFARRPHRVFYLQPSWSGRVRRVGALRHLECVFRVGPLGPAAASAGADRLSRSGRMVASVAANENLFSAATGRAAGVDWTSTWPDG